MVLDSKLLKLIILFIIIISTNNKVLSQSRGEYKILSIDSTTLTYYYKLNFKKVGYNYHYTVLSKKSCTTKDNRKALLKVGNTYSLEFIQIDRIMEVWQGVDSVYIVHVSDDIRINDILFFSQSKGTYPYKSNEICGIYYSPIPHE